MKPRNIALLIALPGLLLAASAGAETGAEMLKSKGCLNCHDAEKKKVGPSMKDIAAKKAGKQDELVAKVRDAKGHRKVKATEDEIKATVAEVLKTK